MQIVIDGKSYNVTQEQVQKAFEILNGVSVHYDQLIRPELENVWDESYQRKCRKLMSSIEPAKSQGRPPLHADKHGKILSLRAKGKTWAEVAEALGISVPTAIRITKGD